VNEASGGNLEPLIDKLTDFNSGTLRVVLTNENNGILDLFELNPEHLANVICRLNFKDLHEILTNDGNEILNLLMEKGKPEHLANVLDKLDSEDLLKILTDNQEKILHSFKEKPEYLIEVLRDLGFWGLDEVHMDEIFNFL
jgi:Mg/Co/Ni transporter MgtE